MISSPSPPSPSPSPVYRDLNFDVFEYTSGRLIRCRRRANSTSTSSTSTEGSLGQTYEKKEKEDLPLSSLASYIHLSFYLLFLSFYLSFITGETLT